MFQGSRIRVGLHIATAPMDAMYSPPTPQPLPPLSPPPSQPMQPEKNMFQQVIVHPTELLPVLPFQKSDDQPERNENMSSNYYYFKESSRPIQ